MHTKASQLYRETRIPEHTVQCFASARVLGYLEEHYGHKAVERHTPHVFEALLHLETTLH